MDCGFKEVLSFEYVFIRIQSNFFRLAGRENINAASGIAANCDLAEINHPIAEVGKYRNQHDETVVDLTLGNGHL
jgi:hypothetical protein